MPVYKYRYEYVKRVRNDSYATIAYQEDIQCIGYADLGLWSSTNLRRCKDKEINDACCKGFGAVRICIGAKVVKKALDIHQGFGAVRIYIDIKEHMRGVSTFYCFETHNHEVLYDKNK